jgi:putative transposase
MKKSRFSEEQIITILREGEGASTIREVCAKHNLSQPTYYAWKRKYGGLDVSEARRLRALEDENGRLKRIVAELSVQNQILQEVNAKNGKPGDQASDGARKSGERSGLNRSGLPGTWSGSIQLLPSSK